MGKDVDQDYRFTRSKIGLVGQEISLEVSIRVFDSVKLQAGYFGLRDGTERAERILKGLSLWDKRRNYAQTLSGGMKRRVMIAKAMVHDPEILFLDEPTAGVDFELRQNLWQMVDQQRQQGKTIILTTHYLEEAQQMADRIGIINNGRLVTVDTKEHLMQQNNGASLADIYAEIVTADRAKTL